jgi:N-acetylmuramoyl-L-alanine amidase
LSDAHSGVGPAEPTLRRGGAGAGVARLHQHLLRAGLPVQGDRLDHFGAATEETVRAFQRRRRLQVDGICGPDTWSALREEPLAIGDRLLSLRKPMQRGDDVHQLQQQLSALGFDAGRPDGIFGSRTDAALRDFQRNAALAVDGICGRDTLAAMQRMGGLAAGSISELRERESFAAAPRALPGRHVLLASRPPAAPVVAAIAVALRDLGARCSTSCGLELDTDAAREANDLDADLCVLVQGVADPAWRCAYYESGRYRSFRGYAIALRVAEQLAPPSASADATTLVAGLSVGVLRETRMPAVVVQLELTGPERSEARSAAVADGIRRGFEEPPELDEAPRS